MRGVGMYFHKKYFMLLQKLFNTVGDMRVKKVLFITDL